MDGRNGNHRDGDERNGDGLEDVAGSDLAPARPSPVARLADGRRSRRPRTVLVLGGGGMRGFAHIGVIRAIEQLGLAVDEVIGTSMGAVMGAFYANGSDSEEMEEIAAEISIKDYLKLNLVKFLVRGYRHASIYKGKTFRKFLDDRLGEKSFDDLAMPFFCNALSLTRGYMRYFGLPGDTAVSVADAVYASSCLPGVFEPPKIGEDHFIDGGMTEVLCLKLAHARRPELVIAVDLSDNDRRDVTPFRATLPHILFQTYSIMGSVLNEHLLHRFSDDRTILLKPKVSEFGVLDQPDTEEVVRLGEREALEVLGTHPLTRWMCDRKVLREIDRSVPRPRDHVQLDVDQSTCINCGVCAATCVTNGFADVPFGSVVRKLHNYECTRDGACERACPVDAIRLRNL